MLKIAQANSEIEIGEARKLFEEYAASLNFSLCFQGFAEELAALPGSYAPPAGRLLLAWEDGRAMGCVALRRFKDETAELKRLYVRPERRGGGLGQKLVLAAIAEARKADYRKIRLDTLPSMERAIVLYQSLGFEQITSYHPNPHPGALFMELTLKP